MHFLWRARTDHMGARPWPMRALQDKRFPML